MLKVDVKRNSKRIIKYKPDRKESIISLLLSSVVRKTQTLLEKGHLMFSAQLQFMKETGDDSFATAVTAATTLSFCVLSCCSQQNCCKIVPIPVILWTYYSITVTYCVILCLVHGAPSIPEESSFKELILFISGTCRKDFNWCICFVWSFFQSILILLHV